MKEVDKFQYLGVRIRAEEDNGRSSSSDAWGKKGMGHDGKVLERKTGYMKE